MTENAAIPADPSEVTPDWLETALAERFPGTGVESVDVLEIHHGTNSNARLRVRYRVEDTTYAEPTTLYRRLTSVEPDA